MSQRSRKLSHAQHICPGCTGASPVAGVEAAHPGGEEGLLQPRPGEGRRAGSKLTGPEPAHLIPNVLLQAGAARKKSLNPGDGEDGRVEVSPRVSRRQDPDTVHC